MTRRDPKSANKRSRDREIHLERMIHVSPRSNEKTRKALKQRLSILPSKVQHFTNILNLLNVLKFYLKRSKCLKRGKCGIVFVICLGAEHFSKK